MTSTIKTLVLLACVTLSIGACKDKDDDSDKEQEESVPEPECKAITDACHTVDTGPGDEIYTCHSEIAHENKAEKCAAEKDRCIALCIDAGGGSD